MENLNYSYLLPEREHKLTELSSDNDDVINNIIEENKTVTAFVEEIKDNELIARLGSYTCHLPFNEVTIYPLTYSKNTERKYPVQICTILHSIIRAKITHIDENGEIYISRKKNMQEAVETLKNCKTVFCKVMALSSKAVFCDIGEGVNAMLNIREITRSRIKNTSDYFHVGDKFSCRVMGFDDLNRFLISYKEMFKKYNPEDYQSGDSLECTVYSPVDEKISGFYVSVNPQVSGILDVTSWMPTLNYGDKVEAIVTKSGEKGLKLRYKKVIANAVTTK